MEKRKEHAKPVQGEVYIADAVVATIAGVAAREIEGVYQLGKGTLRRALGQVAGTSQTTQGVSVEVGKKEVAIDLALIINYGFNIPMIVNQVRSIIIDRLGHMTGLIVKEINIEIVDIHYEGKGKEMVAKRVE